MGLIRRHHISFTNAANGIKWAFSTQPNFRVHVFFSAIAIFLSIALGISTVEMILIILTIILGLSVEMVNTSIESMTDLISTEWHQQAKIAKDVSAGMMLLTAIGATIVGCLVFLPRIYSLIVFHSF